LLEHVWQDGISPRIRNVDRTRFIFGLRPKAKDPGNYFSWLFTKNSIIPIE